MDDIDITVQIALACAAEAVWTRYVLELQTGRSEGDATKIAFLVADFLLASIPEPSKTQAMGHIQRYLEYNQRLSQMPLPPDQIDLN